MENRGIEKIKVIDQQLVTAEIFIFKHKESLWQCGYKLLLPSETAEVPRLPGFFPSKEKAVICALNHLEKESNRLSSVSSMAERGTAYLKKAISRMKDEISQPSLF